MAGALETAKALEEDFDQRTRDIWGCNLPGFWLWLERMKGIEPAMSVWELATHHPATSINSPNGTPAPFDEDRLAHGLDLLCVADPRSSDSLVPALEIRRWKA